MKKIKVLFVLLIISIAISCGKDEDNNLNNQLIGEWMRSDFKEDFEYKLMFNADESGFKTVRIGTMETTITSSLVTFNWKIDNNLITLTENDDVIKTPISFNAEGQLVLRDYSEFLFNRID